MSDSLVYEFLKEMNVFVVKETKNIEYGFIDRDIQTHIHLCIPQMVLMS